MAFYFAIIFNWHLSSSEKSLVGKKIHPIYLNISLFFQFSFSLTNVCLPCQLRKAYAVLWAANRFVGSETSKNNEFWKLKFQFAHFPRNTRFLSLDGPVIIWIYLRITDKHFHDQGNVRHPSSKLLKCDSVQTWNTFRNDSLRIFAAANASLVFQLFPQHEILSRQKLWHNRDLFNGI